MSRRKNGFTSRKITPRMRRPSSAWNSRIFSSYPSLASLNVEGRRITAWPGNSASGLRMPTALHSCQDAGGAGELGVGADDAQRLAFLPDRVVGLVMIVPALGVDGSRAFAGDEAVAVGVDLTPVDTGAGRAVGLASGIEVLQVGEVLDVIGFRDQHREQHRRARDPVVRVEVKAEQAGQRMCVVVGPDDPVGVDGVGAGFQAQFAAGAFDRPDAL